MPQVKLDGVAAVGSEKQGILTDLGDANIYAINYGIDVTGATDSTAAVLAADAAAEAGGGDVIFPEGIIRIDGQLTLSAQVEGAGIESMRPRRWIGAGAWMDATASAHVTIRGTVLDCRYASGPALLLKPRGFFELSGITLTNYGTDHNQPFVKITNTTCLIHATSFIGHYDRADLGQSITQDAIILGGTTLDVIGNADDSPFQGYGTVIRRCYFQRIRRACSWQMFANDVRFAENVFWAGCGGSEAIWIDPVMSGQYSAGATIENNTVEMSGYNRFATINRGTQISMDHNGLYDVIVPTFTANSGTDVITTSSEMQDLAKVFLRTSGTLPAGLSLLTGYYLIKLTATTFKLATSYSNAVADTGIDITDTGTGTHEISYLDTTGVINKSSDSTLFIHTGIMPSGAPVLNTTDGCIVVNMTQGEESLFDSQLVLRSDNFKSTGTLFDGTSGSVIFQTDADETTADADTVGVWIRGDSNEDLWKQQRNGSITIGGTVAVGITTPTWYLTNAGVGRLGGGGNFKVSTGSGGSVLTLEGYRTELVDHTGAVVMSVQSGGVIKTVGLPTSDPAVAGQLWNNSGVLTVSAG